MASVTRAIRPRSAPASIRPRRTARAASWSSGAAHRPAAKGRHRPGLGHAGRGGEHQDAGEGDRGVDGARPRRRRPGQCQAGPDGHQQRCSTDDAVAPADGTEEGHLGGTVEDVCAPRWRRAPGRRGCPPRCRRRSARRRPAVCLLPASCFSFGLDRLSASVTSCGDVCWALHGQPNPHAAPGPARVLGHQVDVGALVECCGHTLCEAEMELADGGGISCRDLDERTTPEDEVTAPAVGEGRPDGSPRRPCPPRALRGHRRGIPRLGRHARRPSARPTSRGLARVRTTSLSNVASSS